MQFATADLHFNHPGIIESCKRPFANLFEMHKALIDNWNSVVKNDDDIVYVLGDFILGKDVDICAQFLDRLNGKKILILGNHDRMSVSEYLEAGFIRVASSLDIKLKDIHGTEYEFLMVHDPAVVAASPFKYHFVGHVHTLFNKYITDTHQVLLNVGVDRRNFIPVTLDSLGVTKELLRWPAME